MKFFKNLSFEFEDAQKPTILLRHEPKDFLVGKSEIYGLKLLGIDPSLVSNANFTISIHLKKGRHELVLLKEGIPLNIEIEPHTTAVFTSSAEGSKEALVVKTFRLEFHKPLRILNPIEALTRLAETRALGLEALQGALKTLDQKAIEKEVVVEIFAVSLRSRSDNPHAYDLAFTGIVRLSSGMKMHFGDFVLPRLLLPSIFLGKPTSSLLENVLQHAPSTLKALLEIVEKADGKFSANIVVPDLLMEIIQADDTRLSCTVSPDSIAMISGRLVFEHKRLRRLRIEQAKLVTERGSNVVFSAQTTLSQSFTDLELTITILRGSVIKHFGVALVATNPWLLGTDGVKATIEKAKLHGRVKLHSKKSRLAVDKTSRLAFSALISVEKQVVSRRNRYSCVLASPKLSIFALLRPRKTGLELVGKGSAQILCDIVLPIAPLLELGLKEKELWIRSLVSFKAYQKIFLGKDKDLSFTIKPSGYFTAGLRNLDIELDRRKIEIPAGTKLLGRWKTRKEAEVLEVLMLPGKRKALFVSENSKKPLSSDFSKKIQLNFLLTHPFGLSLVRESAPPLATISAFFSSRPDRPLLPDHITRALESDTKLILGSFNQGIASFISELFERVFSVTEEIEQTAKKKPGEIFTTRVLARLLSRALSKSDDFSSEFERVLERVTKGEGLDVDYTKTVIRKALGTKGFEYEIDCAVRFFNLLLSPTEAIEKPHLSIEEPLANNEALRKEIKSLGLLSADDLYSMKRIQASALYETAPYMSLGQIEYLLKHHMNDENEELRKYLELCKRAKEIAIVVEEEGYGGISSKFGAKEVASLSSLALKMLERNRKILGPWECAVLLRAGILDIYQGASVQLCNRLLLHYLAKMPEYFTVEVLTEMAYGVEHILAGVLYGFLHQDQDELTERIDLRTFLQERLGFEVPRQEDFMALGKKARMSYFEALWNLATKVIEKSEFYRAKKVFVQEYRHPAFAHAPAKATKKHDAYEEVKKAIENADMLARKAQENENFFDAAKESYREAIELCANVLRENIDAVDFPHIKHFLERNEEALRVFCVVRNVQEGIDDTREWLQKRVGSFQLDNERDLIDKVVRALYAREEDKKEILADPLVYMLLPPPEGAYDFTIVFCSGVVTDGALGRELEDTVKRLYQRHKIKTVRAHTGLFRPLEYNAHKIIEAIREAKTPYGLLGYSQGCANMLMAESMLMSGTPDEQALLQNLVARLFLYSAGAGSAHGTSGMLKYKRALIEGEKMLKHYQGLLSRESVESLLRLLRAFLESRTFIKTIAGAHSLTIERAYILHRDGQFKKDCLSSCVRAIVEEDQCPDALLYLYNIHKKLMPDCPCDSQVSCDEAVPYSKRVQTPWSVVLKKTALESKPLATHHWAPVSYEIENLKSIRDEERGVYMFPKDVHIFPWVWLNARFGMIKVVY